MGAWDLFNALLDLFRPPAEPEPPVFMETVSDGTLRTLLIDQLNADPAHVHLSDAQYDLFDRESLDRLLAWFAIGRKPWLAEKRDCDDHARALAGKESAWASRRAEDPNRAGSSAFAEVWGDFGFGYHAMNAWVSPDRRVWLVEPQNGSVYAPPTGTKVGLVLC